MAVKVKMNPAAVDTAKMALHLCLKRIKEADNERDLSRLTEELQRVVFRGQYRNADRREAASAPHETSG